MGGDMPNYYNLKPKDRMQPAVDLLNSGMTYQQVADKMGLTLSQIKYLFKKYTQDGTPLRHIELSKINRIVDLFKEEPACSFTAYQVACVMGLSVSTVNRQLHEFYNQGLIKRVYQGHYQYKEAKENK